MTTMASSIFPADVSRGDSDAGDGTVPEKSGNPPNVYSNTRHPVIQRSRQNGAEHGDLCNDGGVISYVISTIGNLRPQ